ncbi:MAG: succinate--CoA ligase subunit beta, partial [Roseibacillus sp.]|nr:succinate--CoA ligase subunit beta [Roseibacillus sp.]
MNIHEYQAKILFDQFWVPIPRGQVAGTPEEAAAAADELGGDRVVVKSQVHAGGRGKGTFKSGFQGGVHLGAPSEVSGIAARMLGEVLVTKQTGEEGRLVRKVMVVEAVDVEHEYYLAILMD